MLNIYIILEVAVGLFGFSDLDTRKSTNKLRNSFKTIEDKDAKKCRRRDNKQLNN